MTFADMTAPTEPSSPHPPVRTLGASRRAYLASGGPEPAIGGSERTSSGGGPVAAPSMPAILVVDDDADIRESLAFLLEGEGYEVHAAADGRQALALLERIPLPALALIDLRMPVMDGVELIEAMRKDPRWARLPVVAFSAASTIAVPDGVLLLHKPIGVKLLLATVQQRRAS